MEQISFREVQEHETSAYTITVAENLKYQSTRNRYSADPEVEITIENSELKESSQGLKKLGEMKQNFLELHPSYDELTNAIYAVFKKIDPNCDAGDLSENLIELALKRTFPISVGMSPEDAKTYALALSLYTGPAGREEINWWTPNYLGINGFLGRVFDSVPIPEDEKPYFIIVSCLFKALNNLPTSSAKCVRVLHLSQKEQAIYKEGTIFAWKYLNSFKQGEKPMEHSEKENTYFITEKSRTGRNIAQYSNVPDENEVLFPAGCTFMVVKKEIKDGMTCIYLREEELGNTEDTTILVDERIDDENYEYQEVLDKFSSQEHRHGISIVRKSSRKQALAFLKSPFGQESIFKNKKFKVITILRKSQENQGIDRDALIEFLKDKNFNLKAPSTQWLVQTREEVFIQCYDQNHQIKQVKSDDSLPGGSNSNDTLLSTNMSHENSKMIDPIKPNTFSSASSVDWNMNSELQSDNLMSYVSGGLGVRALANEESLKYS